MRQYIDIELQTLIDLLVKQTNEYSEMRHNGKFAEAEFTQYRKKLAELQQAIKLKLEAESKKMKNVITKIP